MAPSNPQLGALPSLSVSSTDTADSITWQKEIADSASPRSGSKVDVPVAVQTALLQKGFDVDREGVVRWGNNSSIHPRRWPLLRKSYDTAVICLMEGIMTLISNCGSSIAPYADRDLGMGTTLAIFYFTTLYLLGQALGGLVLPPIAESFGGRSIYLSSTIAYAACCVILGSVPSVPVIAVFRFGSGFLSAMPATVACGTLENMWDTKARVWLIHLWISCAVAGLAFAPTVATAVAESHLGWQWFFYIAAIATGVLALMCCWMTESRPSQLLQRHVKSISRNNSFSGLSLEEHNSTPGLRRFIQEYLTLPLRLFFCEPIVMMTSIMGATVYGVIYLFTPALPVVYSAAPYNFTNLQSSFVSMAIGLGILPTFLPRIYDLAMFRRRALRKEPIEPEDKLFGFYVAAPVLAVGLWWFSATVPPLVNGVSPWASIASLIFFGFAVVEFDNVLSSYLCDTYAKYAASAISPMSFLRAVLSGVFPLFGENMFRRLGPNNALFILASLATVFCGFAVILRRYGREIRLRSPLAGENAADVESDNGASPGAAGLGDGIKGVETV